MPDSRRVLLVLTLLVVVSVPQLLASARQASGQAQPAPGVILSGRITVAWRDGYAGGALVPLPPQVWLFDAEGGASELVADGEGGVTLDTLASYDGQAVTVAGTYVPAAAGEGVARRLAVTSLAGAEAASPARGRVAGAYPWIVILCRMPGAFLYVDDPLAHYGGVMGDSYPGLDHYWREQSYGATTLVGSQVVGWYDLPRPASYYITAYGGYYGLDLEHVDEDCAAAADDDVYFPSYKGVMFVVPLPASYQEQGIIYQGGTTILDRDGQSDLYSAMWISSEIGAQEGQGSGWAGQWVLAHEMAHGFGLPHSSGPYDNPYDSTWDVVSQGTPDANPCATLHPVYNCIGQHTIAVHKDFLDWLPAAQVYVAPPGSAGQIRLERLALPASRNYLLARIPIAGENEFYTVEVRRRVGYDAVLPREAVILHRVDTSRYDRVAQVVDPDGNRNPNDEAAIWRPGEIFTDTVHGIEVCVVAETPTGAIVGIGRGQAAPCTLAPDLAPSYTTAAPLRPSGGQTVTLGVVVENQGGPATSVVVTSTLPAATHYLSGTATTTHGRVVTGTVAPPLVFAVGALGSGEQARLAFDVVVTRTLTVSTVLTGTSLLQWESGRVTVTHILFANGWGGYLPEVGK